MVTPLAALEKIFTRPKRPIKFMNNIQKQRLYFVVLLALGLFMGTGLILYALKQNINVFLTPSQLTTKSLSPDYHFRLGGLVKKGSLVREKEGLTVQFIVTDFKHDITARYVGVLPDLFREGKGVIAEGSINAQGIFIASQVLAKHDENYLPKNVYKAIRNEAA
jgi:cytochrome c-type biogenesis protein CcmE